jgi:hypothetical protein
MELHPPNTSMCTLLLSPRSTRSTEKSRPKEASRKHTQYKEQNPRSHQHEQKDPARAETLLHSDEKVHPPGIVVVVIYLSPSPVRVFDVRSINRNATNDIILCKKALSRIWTTVI